MYLTEYDVMPQVNNVFIMLCIDTKSGKRILTTRERRSYKTKMGFPGGNVDLVNGKYELPNVAAMREWKEETGLPLSLFERIYDLKCFVWTRRNGSTYGFYVCSTTDFIPIHTFIPNNEIAGLDLNLVSDIKKAIAGNGFFMVRDGAKASTVAIFAALGW
jgi:8-oxo-dGTP pyrophosphatase MutT (NUDIX family)